MNKKMMSILFASGNENRFNDLTVHRTTASLPFGGRYRLIDFALSSCVNSGISRIGIITRNNYSSLMDHIRMGRDWDLNRKNSGIAVFPPFVLNTSNEVYKGKIEALYTVLDYIEKAPEDYVVVANANIAANIDYRKILDKHIEVGADLTILCAKDYVNASKRIVLSLDKEKFIDDIYIDEKLSDEEKLISLNIYIVSKDLLVSMIRKAYARGMVDFEKEILFKLVYENRIYGYELEGFAAVIDDVKTYYNESMKLLNYDIRQELFNDISKIYTKVKDSVPTHYGESAVVTNSLVADGCIINGVVENSILFRNVRVEEGAVVKDSIIMEDGTIMQNSKLSYTITDKKVTITENRDISGHSSYPIVIVKNKVV